MDISNVLVANRGEIARRVFATCRRMGIATTAVYSDADAHSPHVAEADSAVRLPGNAPGETYLRGALIIEAALAAGADAVHPGYGFLSENAEFAKSVIEAGLTWIGPPVAAIEQMGSKVEAKKMMDAAGVPVLKQLDPAEITPDVLPVLIKASAGGGGRGMRVVREVSELASQLEAARREAESAFGDPTVFCERYLETGRHIEVQVMADTHGEVWAVGERECSIQRRHQKVVEEAPSPLVERIDAAVTQRAAQDRVGASGARVADGGSMRERLFTAARLAAQAIGYEGAGTVEFLADEQGEFFFLEMNTRLQVEHPVTEQVTGLDLVRLQLQVATGRPLPAHQPGLRGHAIEVRLYAEDPAHEWQPQSGPVHRLDIPGTTGEFAVLREPGVRLDTGVVDGSVVGVHYDPMLSKVISYAETRDEAAHLLASALQRAKIHGLVTNRDLLVRVLRHPAFLAGDTDTAFFVTHGLETLSAPLVSADDEKLSIVAAALSDAAANRAAARAGAGLPSGWRNLPAQPQSKSYESRISGEHEVRYRLTRAGLAVDGFDGLELIEATPDSVTLAVPGERGRVRRHFEIARYGDLVTIDSPLGPVAVKRLPRFEDPADQVAEGSLLAPMPGSVIRLGAQLGDRVEKGQPILWLEAMKMEHTIAAPAEGIVAELNVVAGQQVDVGAVLAIVQAESQE